MYYYSIGRHIHEEEEAAKLESFVSDMSVYERRTAIDAQKSPMRGNRICQKARMEMGRLRAGLPHLLNYLLCSAILVAPCLRADPTSRISSVTNNADYLTCPQEPTAIVFQKTDGNSPIASPAFVVTLPSRLPALAWPLSPPKLHSEAGGNPRRRAFAFGF